MDALKALLSNDKGIVAALLIAAATTLTALGKMPLTEWEGFAEWVFGIYAGASALHGGLAALGGGSSPTAVPPAGGAK